MFRRSLLAWYDQNSRDLPWRKTQDPYRIWVSEIMLQQTRVAAVLEHYRLFLKRFPDVESLAAASESDVLSIWSGLGYYRRARMMRLCAQQIVQNHKGRFPATSEQLQSLPGIGRYTAAAIASIAFAEAAAVVDGNVERVLDRLAGRSLSKKDCWQRAQSMLDQSRPAAFNQAMMELGALVCTPRQPRCGGCPVRKWCATKGERSRDRSRQNPFRKEVSYILNERDGHIRLVQRSNDDSLMAGMWELPAVSPARSKRSGSPKVPKNALPVPWRTFRHSITVTNYTVHVMRGAAPANQGRWVAVKQFSEVPLTGLTRKILRAAGII